jgi:hypothetical protein
MKKRIEQTFEEAAQSQDLDSSIEEIPTPPLPNQPDPSVAATTKVSNLNSQTTKLKGQQIFGLNDSIFKG